MISNPTNFNHVAHMGPGDGMQVLMDLPLVSLGDLGWGRTSQGCPHPAAFPGPPLSAEARGSPLHAEPDGSSPGGLSHGAVPPGAGPTSPLAFCQETSYQE